MEVGSFLMHLQPTAVYDGSWQIAQKIGAFITPLLLVAAILVRMSEEGLSSMRNEGSMTRAVTDMLWWSFVLGAYFGLGALVLRFMNDIYSYIDSVGSISEITKQMQTFIEKTNEHQPTTAWEDVQNVFSMGGIWLVTTIFYYLSLLVVLIEIAFLRFAHAVGLGFVFIYGLIAIPVAISTTFRHTRSWGTFSAFVLMWPVVEGILLGLFKVVFVGAAAAIANDGSTSAMGAATAIKMLYTILNFIVSAILLAAPFVTWAIISNSNGAGALVAPFIAAAAVAGTSLANSAQRIGIQPRAEAFAARMGSGGSRGGRGATPREPRRPGSSGPTITRAAAITGAEEAPASAAPATGAPPDTNPKATLQRAQQRRGVLINRELRKKSST